MEYAQPIIEATQEIFSSMIMLEVAPGEPFHRGNEMLVESLSAIVGMAGSSQVLLAIHLPKQVALQVTEAFLGMEVSEIDDDVCDAIGELANMLGGSIKTLLDPKGSDLQLSIPSAIHGEEYAIECLTDAEDICVPFALNGQTFQVELQVHKD